MSGRVLLSCFACVLEHFHDANTDQSFYMCLSQASLAQRLCSGAERGSVNQLSLYTSPSLPNITLGLPATATATAASNVRRKLPQSWMKLLADRFNCEFVYLGWVVCHNLFQVKPSYSLSLSFAGDLGPAGWRSAAGPLPQPSLPLWWPLDPLPGRGGSRNRWTWCAQSAAPTHGAHGAEPGTEPPGDRWE